MAQAPRPRKMKRYAPPSWCGAVVVALALTVVGCGSTSNEATTSTKATTKSTSAQSTSVHANTPTMTQHTSTTSSPPAVTGYGATTAVWNGTHTPDHEFDPEAVYNPDPSLRSVDGHTGAAYTAVRHESGHVLGYEYHFHSVPISEAKAEVLSSEFPSDTRVVWFTTKGGTCAFMLIQSDALRRELGSKAIGDTSGEASVEFGSGPEESYYSASSVDGALLDLAAYKSPAEAQC